MRFRGTYLQIAIVLFAGWVSVQTLNAQTPVMMTGNHLDFKVFPNPVFGEEAFVSLKGFQEKDLLVVVYDMLGKEIYSRVAISENDGFLFSLESEGHELHRGIYLIVASKNDAVFRQKLIVK
jgi:hypothetical protein